MSFEYFKTILDFNKIAFFNFSFPIPFIMQYIHDNNISPSDDMKIVNNGDNFIKIPWIDIFFLFEGNNLYLEVKDFSCKKSIFFPPLTKKISIVNKNINLPKMKEFANVYYGSSDKIQNYTIKSLHYNSLVQRKILYNVDINDKFAYGLLLNYTNYINKQIREIYILNKKYFA